MLFSVEENSSDKTYSTPQNSFFSQDLQNHTVEVKEEGYKVVITITRKIPSFFEECYGSIGTSIW